jgi:hypothetical protein
MAMSSEDSGFKYDLFISYATKSDRRLAGHLKSFLESFHRTSTGRQKQLQPLKVCLDGFDFVVSADARPGPAHGAGAKPEKVPEMIERYLTQSRMILILCAPESMQSQWVRDEIRFFIDQRGAAAVMLALTHGEPNDPGVFFAPELVTEGLHETGWHDLRAFYRTERHLTGRVFDAERLRLVAFLHGGQSSSDIESLWAREQRRARTIRWVVGTAVAVVTLALAGGVYLQRQMAKEEAMRAQVEASMRLISQAYRHRFSDPFTAAANAYRSRSAAPTGQTEPEMAAALTAVHQVLVERRRIDLQEGNVVKPGSLSFISQASTGPRFTKLEKVGDVHYYIS